MTVRSKSAISEMVYACRRDTEPARWLLELASAIGEQSAKAGGGSRFTESVICKFEKIAATGQSRLELYTSRAKHREGRVHSTFVTTTRGVDLVSDPDDPAAATNGPVLLSTEQEFISAADRVLRKLAILTVDS